MAWDYHLSALIKSASRFIPYFKCQRVATASTTNAEYLSLLGISYLAEIDMELPSGGSVWFKFTAPADRDVQILARELSPDIAGCEYNLYLGASNLSYGDPVATSRTNPMTGVAPTSAVTLLTEAPGTQGPHTTPIFIGKGGASNPNGRSGGTDSSKSGLTSYLRGTGFVGRVYNSSGAPNRFVLRIEFAEINDNLLKGVYS